MAVFIPLYATYFYKYQYSITPENPPIAMGFVIKESWLGMFFLESNIMLSMLRVVFGDHFTALGGLVAPQPPMYGSLISVSFIYIVPLVINFLIVFGILRIVSTLVKNISLIRFYFGINIMMIISWVIIFLISILISPKDTELMLVGYEYIIQKLIYSTGPLIYSVIGGLPLFLIVYKILQIFKVPTSVDTGEWHMQRTMPPRNNMALD